MLRVKGIIVQHLTGDIRALSTMKKALVLATNGYSTLTVKWMSFCGNTTTTPGPLSVAATGTTKTTSGVNGKHLHRDPSFRTKHARQTDRRTICHPELVEGSGGGEALPLLPNGCPATPRFLAPARNDKSCLLHVTLAS